MNDMIKPIVQPLLDAFDMYEITSPALQSEVDDFKERLVAFAEKYDDLMEYYNDYAASGLQEEYTDIISKVAVASMGGGAGADSNEDGTSASGSNSSGGNSSSNSSDAAPPQISVKDFLEQYRPAYDEICKRGGIRGKEAYENVFQVADRTDDMIEAQIILEKERLLWKIVTEDALEIFEKKLEEMDPLYLATTAVLLGQIKCYEKATCDEELEYLVAVQEVEDWKVITDFTCKMNIAATIAEAIIEYLKAKAEVYQWRDDRLAKAGLTGMLNRKSQLRFLVNFLKENMGLTLSDIFDDPGVSIWMLNARNEDEYGKKKKITNPENLKRFREVLENEILADISVKEALLK